MISLEEFKRKCEEFDYKIENEWKGPHQDNQDSNEEQNKNSVLDGVVNPEKYLKAKYKILWILKQPYGLEEGGDLKKMLIKENWYDEMKEYNAYRTWDPIIYVSYGMLNDSCQWCQWDDMDYVHENKEMPEFIQKIAIINVEKVSGTTRTSQNILKKAYNKNKVLLLEQIETYNPDIIIAGNTLPLFYEDLEINPIQKEHCYGDCEWDTNNHRLYINAYHPSYGKRKEEAYVNTIINLVKEWTEGKLG